MSRKGNSTNYPFRGCVVYLDEYMNNFQDRDRLKLLITKLGGKVVEFFDLKMIQYLITDRQQKDEPVKNVENKDIKSHASGLMPRGKQLALAANASSFSTKQQAPDVIDIALKRKIKILNPIYALTFCEKAVRDGSAPIIRPQNSTKPVLKEFKGNFIKVEDFEEKYRPSAKEFKEWPQIYPQSGPFTCPFVSTSLNVSNNSNNPRRASGPTPVPKQEQSQYCEICQESFSSLNEHVVSPTHQKHLKKKENFNKLNEVIRSLPKWNGLCDNADDSSSENSSPSCQFDSPGLLPSTFTLTPSSAQGRFVPLHIAVDDKKGSSRTNEIAVTSVIRLRRFGTVKNAENAKNMKQTQLFDDSDNTEDRIEASCFTAPLLPPLLYPELDILDELNDDESKLDDLYSDETTNYELSLEF